MALTVGGSRADLVFTDATALQAASIPNERRVSTLNGDTYRTDASDLGGGLLLASGNYANPLGIESGEGVRTFIDLATAAADTTLNNGDVLNIKERTTGNGGGGTWDVVLTSTVTPNTFDIVVSTGDATLSLVLRVDETAIVKQFGAVGDGSTDDSAAVQHAITNYKKIRFDDGVFVLNKLIVPGDRHISGNGTVKKLVVEKATESGTWIFKNSARNADSGTDEDITFDGLDFDGDFDGYASDDQFYHLIEFGRVKNLKVIGCKFRNLRGTGIMLAVSDLSDTYTISSCIFEKAGTATFTGNAIFAKGTNGTVVGCSFSGISDTPIGYERATYCTATGNVMVGCGNGLGATLDCDSITFVGNTIRDCSAHGIIVSILSTGTFNKNITISGNTINRCGNDGAGNGIEIQGSTDVTISGNLIDMDSQGTHGIAVIDRNDAPKINSDNVFIKSNVIRNVSQTSISCSNESPGSNGFVEIDGNTIYDGNTGAAGFGIAIFNFDSAYIRNNHIYDTKISPTQRGTFIDVSVLYTVYTGNQTDVGSTTYTNNSVARYEHSNSHIRTKTFGETYKLSSQANSSGADLGTLTADFNSLLSKLKTAGIMNP